MIVLHFLFAASRLARCFSVFRESAMGIRVFLHVCPPLRGCVSTGVCVQYPPPPVWVGHLWICGFAKQLWWVGPTNHPPPPPPPAVKKNPDGNQGWCTKGQVCFGGIASIGSVVLFGGMPWDGPVLFLLEAGHLH